MKPATLFLLLALGGCSLSPTSLTCTVDGDGSHVHLVGLDNQDSQQLKNYAALCSFNRSINNATE